jgi:hypothetical protein
MKPNIVKALVASLFVAVATTGCISESPTELADESNSDVEADDANLDDEQFDNIDEALSANTVFDRASGTKLRVAVWNTFRGSVFPKTDEVWNAINVAGQYDTTRTENAKGIFNAINANVWLLQETVYGEHGLPSGISRNDVDNKIRNYMKDITGDSTWQVKCNGEGLCLMVRGNIKIDNTCMNKARVNGYMLKLPSFGNASLAIANVHYRSMDPVEDTVDMMTQSISSAKIVTGDFNNLPNEERFMTINAIPTLNPVEMVQVIDEQAIHLKPAMFKELFNTHGATNFTPNENGQAFGKSESGKHIDHLFLGSSENNWTTRKSFILNSMLLSRQTLKKYGVSPLAAAITPAKYAPFFKDFMATGKIKPIPSNVSSAVNHDHLPLIVDVGFTDAPSKLTPKLVCP